MREDRTVSTSGASLVPALDQISEFRTISDVARNNFDQPYGAYGRTRRLVCEATGTRIVIDYRPRFRNLASMRVAVIPDDVIGSQRPELDRILAAFEPYELAIVEIAVDFPTPTGLTAAYVRRHVKFGKSRPRRNRRFARAAWLGAPGSARFLRCYYKQEIRSFRVEGQFNRPYLKNHKINTPDDFPRLAALLAKDLGFYEVDWSTVKRYAKRHLRYPDVMVRMMWDRRRNLSEMLSWLRAVVPNSNQFLVPMSINSEIRNALNRWSEEWK